MSANDAIHPLYTPEGRRNPHPIYKRMRAEEPVTRVTDPYRNRPAWLVCRYDDCVAMIKDPRISKDADKLTAEERAEIGFSDAFAVLSQHMLSADPPNHTRLRSLVAKAFTPQIVEGMRPRIAAITERLLDAMVDRKELDLIAEFALPLPVTVIAELLGVPLSDQAAFREWTAIILTPPRSEDDFKRIGGTARQFLDYFMQLINQRRAAPKDDLVSALVAVEEAGDKLDEKELIGMLFLLLIAGHETTVNLIANGTLALLTHPEELARLKADPSLLESAVEEMLRFCGPVETTTARFALEDIEIAGQPIRRGELILASLLSADRDETKFPDPDRFDIGRKPNRHIGFGFGIHFCLGAPLARLEAQLAFEGLLRRFPALRLNVRPEGLEYHPSLLFHAIRKLPVAL